MFGEGVPEGRGSNREGSVAPGPTSGLRDGEKVGIGRAEGAGSGVGVEQVCEVGWGLVVEGFVGEKEEFKLDTLRDREPVETLKHGGDVVTGAGVGEEASRRVLDVLELVDELGGRAVKDAVAVVEAGGDKGVNQSFSSSEGE